MTKLIQPPTNPEPSEVVVTELPPTPFEKALAEMVQMLTINEAIMDGIMIRRMTNRVLPGDNAKQNEVTRIIMMINAATFHLENVQTEWRKGR